MSSNLLNKKGQMTIFVIIAIVIVAGVLIYLFAFRGKSESISAEFMPVYNSYTECIKDAVKEGANLAESQGGYTQLPAYEPANQYAPFSSQLNFLGFPVPYWYYVSGNGIIKEQMPEKKDIESGIASFVENRIGDCNFDYYRQREYSIETGEPKVAITIQDNTINAKVDQEFLVSKDEKTSTKTTHSVSVDSKIGSLYNTAVEIYEKEKNEAFLENYTIDTLRLNAPVDGVELGCGMKIWNAYDVDKELRAALEANIVAISAGKTGRAKGYYDLDITDKDVSFLYSSDWPYKLEINGNVDNGVMRAEPVGTQSGLGIMGFCYQPYHFVYDLSFPVLIQLTDGEEIFQFPVSVVISKNLPRKAELSSIVDSERDDFCQTGKNEVSINVYDVNLNKIDANLSYECFDQECSIGSTKQGEFVGGVPACVNGYIIANANGYQQKKQLFSSNEEPGTDIVMDKEYDVNVELMSGGKQVTQGAFVVFNKETENGNESVSAVFPDASKIKLTEGLYTIQAYLYSNSSVVIPASTKTDCQEVSQTGIVGILGGKKQSCVTIEVPETKIESALSGGGKTQTYMFTTDLAKGKIKLFAEELPKPDSLEQMQYNFESFDGLNLEVDFA